MEEGQKLRQSRHKGRLSKETRIVREQGQKGAEVLEETHRTAHEGQAMTKCRKCWWPSNPGMGLFPDRPADKLTLDARLVEDLGFDSLDLVELQWRRAKRVDSFNKLFPASTIATHMVVHRDLKPENLLLDE
ncbi:hypothetical protein niasHT_010046 [Heterodera trifolii]|uniref:Protein kinase domain-containing protein n=1 Tax=Heterodera trifolii TaxID=157864 RepID=A0ABD2LZI6_9BILA